MMLVAQDLEEDFPRPTQFELSAEESETLNELPEERSILDILSEEKIRENEVLVNSQLELSKDIRTKEEQIGLILRQAYYQKLTTPQWASILSTDNWRESFLRWRYFTQLAEYVKNSTNELFVKKRRLALQNIDLSKQIAVVSAPIEEEIVVEEVSEIVEKNNSNDSGIKTDPIVSKPKDTEVESMIEQEEEWEGGSEVEAFEFTLEDLTLSEEIVSEYASKPELEAVAEEAITLLESDELKFDPAPYDSQIEEPEREIENKPIEIIPEPKRKDAEELIKVVKQKDPPREVIASAEKQQESVVDKSPSTVQAPSVNTVVTSPKVNTPPTVVTSRASVNTSFANSKGRLSWPISGVITDRYGHRKNAAARGLKTDNYGIDMQGSATASVTSVYEGTVLMAIKQAPYDYIVTVKHGDYTTAYYFLDRIYVNVGDVIPKGHTLGTLRPQSAAPFHFEIWEGQDRLNPEPWLQAK